MYNIYKTLALKNYMHNLYLQEAVDLGLAFLCIYL